VGKIREELWPWTEQPQVNTPAIDAFAALNPGGGARPPFSAITSTTVTANGVSILSSSVGTTIAADESKVLPFGSVATILFEVDQSGTNRGWTIGTQTGNFPQTFNVYLNFSGTFYFRWGGEVSGVTSLQFADSNSVGIYLLSVGPAGMQAWRNGILIGSNSATPTRGTTSNALTFQSNDPAYTIKSALYASWSRQFPAAVNASLSRNPWQLFTPRRIPIPTATAAGGAPTTFTDLKATAITSSSVQATYDYAF
jgi:hypothetical protein